MSLILVGGLICATVNKEMWPVKFADAATKAGVTAANVSGDAVHRIEVVVALGRVLHGYTERHADEASSSGGAQSSGERRHRYFEYTARSTRGPLEMEESAFD
jgi:hypothetical protein